MRQTTGSAGGTSLELVPFGRDTDPERFAAQLAPGFGGDTEAAHEILAETCALLIRDPRPHPWGAYLVRLNNRAIGLCAFKTAPTCDGEVEIAYMTFPDFQGRGHATATIAALVEIAEAEGVAPFALTLPEENGSNTALRRNGFVYAGEVDDPDDGLVWRWEKGPGG